MNSLKNKFIDFDNACKKLIEVENDDFISSIQKNLKNLWSKIENKDLSREEFDELKLGQLAARYVSETDENLESLLIKIVTSIENEYSFD